MIVSLLRTALLAATLALAAPIDLSGTWVLDKEASDSVDELLKSQGVSWAQRKVVAGLDVTQVISQSGDSVTVAVDTSKKDRTETLVADGVARQVTSDEGATATVTHSWQGSALVTRSSGVDKQGRQAETTITRTLEDGGGTLRQLIEFSADDGTTASAARIFRKQ